MVNYMYITEFKKANFYHLQCTLKKLQLVYYCNAGVHSQRNLDVAVSYKKGNISFIFSLI